MFSLIPVFIYHHFVSSPTVEGYDSIHFLFSTCIIYASHFSIFPLSLLAPFRSCVYHVWNQITSLFGCSRLPIWRIKFDSLRFTPEAGNTMQDQKGQTISGPGHWSDYVSKDLKPFEDITTMPEWRWKKTHEHICLICHFSAVISPSAR